jgi:hypothetical protein
MKFLKNLKFLFLARGPGETGQARALAKFLARKKAKIFFCLVQRKNYFFLKDDKEFKIFITPEPKDLRKIVEKEKPHFLFLFNSKTWGGKFLEKPPFKKPEFVFCFDSNWLFNSKKYPLYDFVKWADKYFILFPQKIFELGLKENGGNFKIEEKIKEKIKPIGFIPSYSPIKKTKIKKIKEKLGIKKEKFIFSYFSGWGAGHRIWAFQNFIKALNLLVKKRKIKAIYVGPTDNLNQKYLKRDWLIMKEKFSTKEFFFTLASSDLIFMHQGMVTLAQGISCQIPIICNVSILKEELPKLHFWEVVPFKRAGVCEMFTKTTKIKKIAKRIDELLFNKKERMKMIKKQREIFERGEERFFEELKKLL